MSSSQHQKFLRCSHFLLPSPSSTPPDPPLSTAIWIRTSGLMTGRCTLNKPLCLTCFGYQKEVWCLCVVAVHAYCALIAISIRQEEGGRDVGLPRTRQKSVGKQPLPPIQESRAFPGQRARLVGLVFDAQGWAGDEVRFSRSKGQRHTFRIIIAM